MLNPPNDCDYDFQCSGNLKCCEGICGRVCLPPVYGTVCTEIITIIKKINDPKTDLYMDDIDYTYKGK
ncbi:hypothetical protein NXF25_009574 [Crotalus adamanteus]|uniref:WAP domain-containing protein n=1 Tax=Crotalus adamanteus TaxID=8729 RepID=A0AAW1BT99_CROAD